MFSVGLDFDKRSSWVEILGKQGGRGFGSRMTLLATAILR
jgi:hypothetical protein